MAPPGFTHLLRLVGEIRAEVVAGIDLHPPPGADTRCEALLRRPAYVRGR